MKTDDAKKALEWIAARWSTGGWIQNVAKAALHGEDVGAAIKKAEADIDAYLHPKPGPGGLDAAYSEMGRGWGDGRGR